MGAAGRSEKLTPTERTRTFRHEIAGWAGNARKVYWLTTEAQLKAVRDRLDPCDDEFTTVAEVKVPVRPGPPPPDFGEDRDGPRAKRQGWFGPPGPGGPPGLGGPPPDGPNPPGPPAHFEPPADGKFVLVRWTICANSSGVISGTMQ